MKFWAENVKGTHPLGDQGVYQYIYIYIYIYIKVYFEKIGHEYSDWTD